MRTVQLTSSDDVTFLITETIANQSEVIRKMLEFHESSSDCDTTPIQIPLPNVKGSILGMVIEWIRKHEDEQTGDEDDGLRIWETEFVNVELDVTYDLIMAADYLDVSALFHRGCKKIADLIAGKTPEEIRKTFNIENDFTPEEEAELQRQNAWTFERSADTN